MTQDQLNGMITSCLQRHEASIQAMKALATALIATHPNHGVLLERYMENMDVIADSVEKESIALYRSEAQQFQQLILIHLNKKA